MIEKLAGERPDPSQVLLLGEAVFLLLQEVSANDLSGRGREAQAEARGSQQAARGTATRLLRSTRGTPSRHAARRGLSTHRLRVLPPFLLILFFLGYGFSERYGALPLLTIRTQGCNSVDTE